MFLESKITSVAAASSAGAKFACKVTEDCSAFLESFNKNEVNNLDAVCIIQELLEVHSQLDRHPSEAILHSLVQLVSNGKDKLREMLIMLKSQHATMKEVKVNK